MNILAIDTSSNVLSVAVSKDNIIVAQRMINHKKTHSQTLMNMCSEILSECSIECADIDLYAVNIGPGSFTGLRIGIATVKAMSYANEKPVCSISSLEILANNMAYSEAIVCPMIDARNNMIYSSIYKCNKNGKIESLSPITIEDINVICQRIVSEHNEVVFVGDGAAMHRKIIKNTFVDKCIFPSMAHNNFNAGLICDIAYKNYLEGKILPNGFDIQPIYVRASQAEQEYAAKHNING